ncbi:hypothetical protein VXD82_13940 [Mycobacteroides chelonae]|uniref:hypothetical protein n=1 Tax=Mycobacteroides chelonae TaxID=1774 RepID=UPI003204F882
MPTPAIDKGFITDLAKMEKPFADVFAKFNVSMLAQTSTSRTRTDRETNDA